MADGFLRRAYKLETQEDTDAYYSEWAASYDDELTSQGYRTPERCAAALAQFVDTTLPILDIGCGTGLSGRALATAGYTNITGNDVNKAMLALAGGVGVYRELALTDVANPFPFEPGTYAALAAVGVIGVGAAPLEVFGQSLDALAPGGHLVFSLSDPALAVPEFPAAVANAVQLGVVEQRFAEYGPHIEGLGSRSMVYVLRRC